MLRTDFLASVRHSPVSDNMSLNVIIVACVPTELQDHFKTEGSFP